MVEKVSAEQAYMNQVMKKLPKAERGDIYEVKLKDSLWNIAKNKLSTKNPKVTKAQIQDYMYQIAKLNDMTTLEKINKLKVSDKIYLPKDTEAPRKVNTKKVNMTKPVVTNKTVKKTPTKNSAETSVTKLTDQIKNDKSVIVEKMYKGYLSTTDIYHVYSKYKNPISGYQTNRHPLMSFTKNNQNGKIINVSFNDQGAVKDEIRFDYNMDEKGNITTNNILRKTHQGKISPAELNELHSVLNSKISANTPYTF